MMAEALLIAAAILGAAVIMVILVIFTRRSPSAISPILEQRLLGIEGAIGRSDSAVREEFGRGRDENREGSRSLREEVTSLFESLAGSLRASLSDLSTAQQAQLETFATRLNETRTEATTNARNLREEIRLTLNQLGDGLGANIGELITAQREKLDTVASQITVLTDGNERRQETLRANVEAGLGELKTDAGVNARAPFVTSLDRETAEAHPERHQQRRGVVWSRHHDVVLTLEGISEARTAEDFGI
jgi:hypothetical protein